MALFSDLGFANTTSGVKNEMIVINSVTMLKQAIERIEANTRYYRDGILRDVNIYKETPVKMKFLSELDKDDVKGVAIEV